MVDWRARARSTLAAACCCAGANGARVRTGVRVDPNLDHNPAQVLGVLCAAAEYDELPVRHNEDKLNLALAGEVRLRTDPRAADDPHTKANLLLQARAARPRPFPAPRPAPARRRARRSGRARRRARCPPCRR
jgi:hypothetical protein